MSNTGRLRVKLYSTHSLVVLKHRRVDPTVQLIHPSGAVIAIQIPQKAWRNAGPCPTAIPRIDKVSTARRWEPVVSKTALTKESTIHVYGERNYCPGRR